MLRTIRKPRALLLALAAILATVAVVATIAVNRTDSSEQEPSTQIEQWATGPAGQSGPVTVIVQNYPKDPGEPVTKGDFRLLPFGYADHNTPVPQPTCEKPTVNAATED